MIVFSEAEIPNLRFDENVWKRLLEYRHSDSLKVENGGILVGILNPVDEEIIVTDYTEPVNDDKRSRFHFFRSENLHQKAMDKLWEESGQVKTYLGEWHTHDEIIPNPSLIDIREWKRINKKHHNSTHLFFVIVGRKEIGVWTIVNGTPLRLHQTNNN